MSGSPMPRLRLLASPPTQADLDPAAEFIGLVEPGGTVTPEAIATLDAALLATPQAELAYTDEVGPLGPVVKPVWSPERLRGQFYLGGLIVISRSALLEVGGFDARYGAATGFDAALRISERGRPVFAVHQPLYERGTDVDPRWHDAHWHDGQAAVADHLRRTEPTASVHLGDYPGTYRIRRELPPGQRVSVVIPTRGSSGPAEGRTRCYVVEAVRSVLACTEHENLEIVLVCDTATPAAVVDQVRAIAGEHLVVVDYAEPFNFSRKCNVGVRASTGEVIVLLNDDVQVLSPRWIEQLTAVLADPTVAVTGAQLRYDDNTIQHAGLVFDQRGYNHAYLHELPQSPVGEQALHVNREVAGVTGACLAVRRDTYDALGGMDEALPGNYNDVDFCLKVGQTGRRIVWINDVVLYHFESRSRQAIVRLWELDFMRARWGSPPEIDPWLPLSYPPPSAYRRLRRVARLTLNAVARRAGRADPPTL